MTATAFAERAGFHPTTISRWKRVLAAKAKAPTTSMALARVRPGGRAVVASPREASPDAIEVVAGGAVIRVRRGFDAEHLRAIVAALTTGR